MSSQLRLFTDPKFDGIVFVGTGSDINRILGEGREPYMMNYIPVGFELRAASDFITPNSQKMMEDYNSFKLTFCIKNERTLFIIGGKTYKLIPDEYSAVADQIRNYNPLLGIAMLLKMPFIRKNL